jgi:hypothetical protein
MGGFVIGIDVGGTKVALAAADLTGRRLSESRFGVPEAGDAQEVLTQTVRATASLASRLAGGHEHLTRPAQQGGQPTRPLGHLSSHQNPEHVPHLLRTQTAQRLLTGATLRFDHRVIGPDRVGTRRRHPARSYQATCPGQPRARRGCTLGQAISAGQSSEKETNPAAQSRSCH